MDKVSDNLLIGPKYLAELREIFREHFSLSRPLQVWAFGSRVNGLAHSVAHSGSDLDLALVIDGDSGFSQCDFHKLQESLRESNIPFLLDLCRFDTLPDSFKKEIEENYVVVYDGRGCPV